MGEIDSKVLFQSLIDVVNNISSTGEYRKIHKRECSNLSRRIKMLAPLFEELKEFREPLPEDAIDCFISLRKALYSAKDVLLLCHDGSKLRLGVQMEAVVKKFQEVTAELGQALDGFPYDLLFVSDDVREQVELVHTQLKRAKGIDVQDMQLSRDIQYLLSMDGSGEPDRAVLERLAEKLELQSESSLKQERVVLENLQKGADPDESVHSMFYILKQLSDMDLPSSLIGASDGFETDISNEKARPASAERYSSADIPEDFRCPISLELMKDPVILASGQTYERACIRKWLADGHQTCPITRVHLSHHELTPNYVLRRLIAQWCDLHGFVVRKSKEIVIVEALLHKLLSKKVDEQRVAACELRLMAKRSVENRICIAEAGAIPLLVNLLKTEDQKTQEHAVTALLNLSINDANKGAIVYAGAIDPIVGVLKSGSMEARENAAATLFSLSVVDENKVTIGDSGAIPALVNLLRDGTARGKKDAATALFNLSIYQGNKAKAVTAGVVPPLMTLLVDQTACMVDEALAILAILASHPDGRVAIGQASAIPTLVELISSGSDRNKENAAAVLLALSQSDPSNITLAKELGAYELLKELSQTGTPRAKRKSSQLLEHMRKMSPDEIVSQLSTLAS